MSARRVIDANAEVVTPPTHVDAYIWASSHDGMQVHLGTSWPDEKTARTYDPRRSQGMTDRRAALLCVRVNLADLERLT